MSAPFSPPFAIGAARATAAGVIADEIKRTFDPLEWEHAESLALRIGSSFRGRGIATRTPPAARSSRALERAAHGAATRRDLETRDR